MKKTLPSDRSAPASAAAYQEKLDNCRTRMVQLESFANTVVESEAKSKSILEAAVDGIIIIRPGGHRIF